MILLWFRYAVVFWGRMDCLPFSLRSNTSKRGVEHSLGLGTPALHPRLRLPPRLPCQRGARTQHLRGTPKLRRATHAQLRLMRCFGPRHSVRCGGGSSSFFKTSGLRSHVMFSRCCEGSFVCAACCVYTVHHGNGDTHHSTDTLHLVGFNR